MNNLEDQYAEYIYEHAMGDRMICNGDSLIRAMENGYLLTDFCDSIGITVEKFEDQV